MNMTICNPPVLRAIPVAANAFLALAVMTAVGCNDQKQQADGLVRVAIQHSDAERPTDAVKLLDRAIALNPGLAEAFYLRGTCFAKLNQTQKAAEDLSAATRLKPGWDEAWCALGIAQLTSGESDLGIASLTRALQVNADMRSALEARARGNRDLHRTEAELHDLSELLRTDPANCAALLRRGILLSESNPEQSTEDFSNVISRDRDNATAWMQRGLCYRRIGDTDRALADLNIACRLQSDDFRPWLERGRILRNLNRAADAISDLSKAVELAPEEFDAQLQLGLAYLDNSQFDSAHTTLLEAEKLSPNNSELSMALAQTAITDGRYDEARERLSKLLAEESSLSPSLLAAARISMAQLLRQTNNIDEAMSQVQQVLAAKPGDTNALQIRAALLANLHRREEAIADYTRLTSSGAALETEAVAESVLERGRLHLEEHDWSAATADFSRYLEDHPDDVDVLTLRARAWLEQNDAGHAIGDLTRALLQDRSSADLYILRAAAFDQFKEPAAALADLQKAASLRTDDPDLHQELAERLFKDRQFSKAAKTLDILAAAKADQLSAPQRLLRGRARLADSNLNGAYEDACALSSVESASAGSVKPEDVILLQCTIALRRHDDVEALRLVKNISEDSLSPDTLLLYGQTLARHGQPDEAIRIFSSLIKTDSSNMAALHCRAGVYMETADWQAALNDAGLLLKETPEDSRALVIKGTSLYEINRFREALETLEHPALQNRNTIELRWMRIRCCEDQKLTFREMEELNALLGMAPTHQPARMLRAALLEKLGYFDDAITDLSAVLQQDPTNLTAITNRALLYQRRGKAVAAVEDFTNAISLSPHAAELYYRRGVAQHQAGQPDDARRDLDKAIELDADLADAWYVIGNVEAGRGHSELAITAYAKAVEIQPAHAAAWYNRGNLLFNQSKLQQAADCWTIAITIQPELFRAYNNRAAAFDRMDRDAEAVTDYETTLKLNPGFIRAWDNMAWLLATTDNKNVRDPERAVKLATRACELSEFKDWACLNTLATCCAENQEYDAAVKWARQARAIAPESDRSELDQIVAAYEARLKSKRLSERSGGSIH